MKRGFALIFVCLLIASVFFVSSVSAFKFSNFLGTWFTNPTGNIVVGDITYTCTDSDGGVNYGVKGTVVATTVTPFFTSPNGTVVGGPYSNSFTDYCSGNPYSGPNNLVEYSCSSNDAVTSFTYSCPIGCKDGACVSSTIIDLSSSSSSATAIGGIKYTFKLVSATDTSATIQVTYTIISISSQIVIPNQVINKGQSKTIPGTNVVIAVVSASQANNLYSATIAVSTPETGIQTIKSCAQTRTLTKQINSNLCASDETRRLVKQYTKCSITNFWHLSCATYRDYTCTKAIKTKCSADIVGGCTGTATACSYFSWDNLDSDPMGACEKQQGCSWSGNSNTGKCTGTPISCSSFPTGATCIKQDGCTRPTSQCPVGMTETKRESCNILGGTA